MHVLALNQFYAPDHSATSQLLTELCEDLAAAGERVTVVASRGTYLGGEKLPARERRRGVEVLRPWATSLGKGSIARRLLDYGTFGASALAEVVRVARPDVMIALTTPPMIAAGAAVVAKARGIPLVPWVQDVYPEVAVAFGVLQETTMAARALAAVGRASHRAARLTVTLSEGMAERVVAQGQARERIRVIPNWSDGRLVHPTAEGAARFRREHDLEGRFVAMYSGNLGAGHELVPFVAAARALAARRPELALVFVGDGVRRAEAEQAARGLTNVRFLPYQPRERLAESLSAADVHLASLQPGLDGLLVPSKLYGVMAAGRPLLYLGPASCELARVIRRWGVGWHVEPGEPAALVAALEAAMAEPLETRGRGERARATFVTEFDRPRAVERWRAVLREAVAEGPHAIGGRAPKGE
ncbi:MAG: glycosyltransferase family 4 protein [Deltaproteobacteria bacterium]|nr:glycosyltransferase family 4 protein [Deltaproteobacteria bacterium]